MSTEILAVKQDVQEFLTEIEASELAADVSGCELRLALKEVVDTLAAGKQVDDAVVYKVHEAAFNASDSYSEIRRAAKEIILERQKASGKI